MFGLLQVVAFAEMLKGHLPSKQVEKLFLLFLITGTVIAFAILVLLTMNGYIAPWSGRLYSLWDTAYAAKFIPIIASVSEHQPTAWPAFFSDLQLMIALLPAGIYYCFTELRDEHVFVVFIFIYKTRSYMLQSLLILLELWSD
jgi:dolichyl-diphosphooligosaccharide--protein glycosyltransferase